MPLRKEIWNNLATVWKPENLSKIGTLIGPDELETAIQKILKGEIHGRIVLKHASA
jgi:hypothetical protein